MSDFLHISEAGQINDLIVRAEAMDAPGRAELLRGVRDAGINTIFVDRFAVVPMKALRQTLRPLLVVVGDDDFASTGPAAWPSWNRLKTWARGALLHAAAGDVGSYRLAIAGTLARRKLVLIETSSQYARDWALALRQANIPTVAVLPRGGEHPVLPAKKDLQ